MALFYSFDSTKQGRERSVTVNADLFTNQHVAADIGGVVGPGARKRLTSIGRGGHTPPRRWQASGKLVDVFHGRRSDSPRSSGRNIRKNGASSREERERRPFGPAFLTINSTV